MLNNFYKQLDNKPQICSHLQCSHNIRSNYLPIAVYKYINTLHNIQEYLTNQKTKLYYAVV